MKILVVGSGYVASSYMRAVNFLGYHPIGLSRSWINYMDFETLNFFLAVAKPDVVINAAGYTGSTVDDCQANKTECYQANVVLARNLAMLCADCKAKLIHISSGCIFNGQGEFTENDQPNFVSNFYQQTKFSAEQDIISSGAQTWIFRLRMPFDYFTHPRNWLTKLCRYRKILDGLNSITFMGQVAMRSFQLLEKAPPGIYHAASSEPVRTADVARLLHEAGVRLNPVELYDPEEFLADGHVRRSEAVLSVKKFETAYGSSFGEPLCSIRWCIDRLKAGGALWSV